MISPLPIHRIGTSEARRGTTRGIKTAFYMGIRPLSATKDIRKGPNGNRGGEYRMTAASFLHTAAARGKTVILVPLAVC